MKTQRSKFARPKKSSPKKSPRGLFLSFEGGEGSGKSTQARGLFEALQKRGIACVWTREPGGTEIGARIRELVLDAKVQNLSPRAELLLYEADRAQNMDTLIVPALAAGQVVICDRHADSSTVYQGMCRNLGVKNTNWLNGYATAGVTPDRVFVLDIAETAGMARVKKRALTSPDRAAGLDRFEKEAIAFHRKVRRGFLLLAKQNPRRFRVLDAKKTQTELAELILTQVRPQLEKRGLWK